jgi:hypothetical protein
VTATPRGERESSAGKILYAGSSNFAGWHIAGAQAAAARRTLMGAQGAGFCADLRCQVLVRLDLVPMLSEALRCPAFESPDAGALFLDHPLQR